MKILIIRFSSIGDIVLTTPVIRAIKTQLGKVELHYATKKQYESILSENPYIDKIHPLEGSIIAYSKALKREKFDLIIDLHHNLRSRIVKTITGVKAHSFDKINLKKWLKVRLKLDLLPNRHIVDRYMDTVQSLGVKTDALGLEYFIPEKDEVELEWLPEPFRRRFVALVIGAKFETKRLPFERLVELCDRINKPIVLLGGKEDQALGQRIEDFFRQDESKPEEERFLKEKLNKKAQVYNACGKFNLHQSASLVRQAQVVFTHDTGLMHVAAAFKKKIYSIWGNTTPSFGMYPYRTSFVVFENNKIKCRPCSKIGFSKCPKGHFKCMKELVFDFYIPD
jgi:ADP-heptose:LPS heptosyltransferase